MARLAERPERTKPRRFGLSPRGLHRDRSGVFASYGSAAIPDDQRAADLLPVDLERLCKRASDGQTISELSFGFWRFLIAKKLTGVWPDLASGFRTHPIDISPPWRDRLHACTSFATAWPIISASGATLPRSATKICSCSLDTSTLRCQLGYRLPAPCRRRSVPDRERLTK